MLLALLFFLALDTRASDALVSNPFVQPQTSLGFGIQTMGYKGWSNNKTINTDRSILKMLDPEYLLQYSIERNHVHGPLGGQNIGYTFSVGGYQCMKGETLESLEAQLFLTIGNSLWLRYFAYLWNPETHFVKATIFAEPGLLFGVVHRSIYIQMQNHDNIYPQSQLFLGVSGKVGSEWFFSKWVGIGMAYGLQLNGGVSSAEDRNLPSDEFLPKNRVFFPSISWGHMGSLYIKTTLF